MTGKMVASLAAASCSLAVYGQERPNIILFLVDDMGLMDTSVPFVTDGEGRPVEQPLNRWYHTPNMERLANQGIRFSTFYAQSVSSPSRTSIMTGQNAARHRTTNWIYSESNNRTEYGPRLWNWDGLENEDLCYPQILKDAGYKTIHVGKAHFGRIGSEGEDPRNIGFEVNVAGSSIGEPGSYLGRNGYGWLGGTRSRAVPGLEKYHGTDTFLTEALTIEAKKEIAEAVKQKRPFYLNMAHYAVHTPIETDPRFADNYKNGEFSENNYAVGFATLIEGMDKSLGDLLDYVDSLGVAENTLLIFLGDNGGDAPLGGADEYGSSAPFKGKKGSEYEGGMRVPFIMAWCKNDPNNEFQKRYEIAQGEIQTAQATIMDIYPTVLSVAGIPLPKNHTLDGADLKKLSRGEKDASHRDDFLMHFPHEHRGSYFTVYRKGDWKLIYYYNPNDAENPSQKLYNLAEDPYEHNDLAESNPKMVRKMCAAMIKRLEKEKALYPEKEDGTPVCPVVPPKTKSGGLK